MDTDQTAPAFWGARAAEYDAFIRRVVPRYDELTERLFDHLPASASSVLELGTGTGNLTLRLAARWPEARFTLVDAAPEMLDVARARLTERFPAAAVRARFLPCRFEDARLEPASFDLAVASLSLHHVLEVGDFYRLLRPALVDGGRLAFSDGVRGATPEEHEVHMRRWRAFWEEPGKLTPEEIRDVVDHVSRHDHYRSLAEHFRLLGEAGFREPDCVWRDGLFAVLTARAGG